MNTITEMTICATVIPEGLDPSEMAEALDNINAQISRITEEDVNTVSELLSARFPTGGAAEESFRRNIAELFLYYASVDEILEVFSTGKIAGDRNFPVIRTEGEDTEREYGLLMDFVRALQSFYSETRQEREVPQTSRAYASTIENALLHHVAFYRRYVEAYHRMQQSESIKARKGATGRNRGRGRL